jgi:hypothetical protein
VNDAMIQMQQRIQALKEKAGQRILEQQEVTAKLEGKLALTEELLRSALALLKENGIGHRVTL